MSIFEQAIEKLKSMQVGDTVSPSGKSIVDSVSSGEVDPTVDDFNQARGSFVDTIVKFFQNFNFLSNPVFWVVVAAIIILILYSIIKKG